LSEPPFATACGPFARTLTLAAALAVLAGVLTGAPASAVDSHVILVEGDRLSPERIEIDNGEMVTWRAPSGQSLHLEMDAHPAGHEVIERTTEIRAIFRLPGRHGYTVTLTSSAGARLRGVVVVRPSEPPGRPLPFCGPGSSTRICFEP
jgi:plastocyanin